MELNKNILNKIIIGTVNFGIKYGISKTMLSQNEVFKITDLAIKNSLKTFDTAQSYGISEKLLGKIKKKIEIITKIIPNKKWKNINFLKFQIQKSLNNLNRSTIHAVLFHDIQILKTRNGKIIFKNLEMLKKKKIIKKIGVSIYKFKDLVFLLKNYNIDILQCPFSIFDTRLIDQGWLKLLKKNKVEVHARSVFLQGILVDKNLSNKKYFNKWKKKLKMWFDYLKAKKIRPVEACINFVVSSKVDKLIIGIKDLSHLKEILNLNFEKKINIPKKLIIKNPKFLNPNLWRT